MSSLHKKKLTRAKVVVLGNEGCGKTAFTVRLLTKRFIGEYSQNEAEMTYRQAMDFAGECINLELRDIKSELLKKDESIQLESAIKWADGFVLIYAVDDRESFNAVSDFRKFIDITKRTVNTPAIIVGNKTDSVNREVTKEEGERISENLKCPFYELSVAESYEDVKTSFDGILLEMRSEYFKHLAAVEKFSRAIHMKPFKSTRSRSKTM
ncbi:ras-related and estrogen-regulated growth inhibitor-like protein isoform X2 [Antedon mediterranea]|uniref:ras-related and estrogen-regulated growth inhibitor-like protein isoform X1 n=1 Tax=Antedon mediterranea TaxID=105859 RepID=UPI003AF96411